MESSGLTIRATNGHVAKYQNLLVTDWTAETLTAALELFRETFATSGLVFLFGWNGPAQPTTKGKGKGPVPYPIPTDASEHLSEFIARLNESMLPEVPEETPLPAKGDSLTLQRRAVEAGAYLTLPMQLQLRANGPPTRLGGDISFVRDLQSLIFNLTVQVLLPELERHGLGDERNKLLKEMYLHTATAWAEDIAHQCQLKALLYQAMDRPEAAGDALLAAFRATPPDEHDYMTKAQAYWTHLIDHRDLASAERFAVHLARAAPLELLDEVCELVRATYQQMFRNSPAP
jgi:hypothetical protein